MRANIKVNYDLKSLLKSEYIYEFDPEAEDIKITDEEFLLIKRRRAETKLIKTKIIYKLFDDKGELTTNEKNYLNKWLNDLLLND